MTKLSKKLWMALLAGTVLLLCCGGSALADDTVYGNTSVRGLKSMAGTVGVGVGPTNNFREYSTGVPEYNPGTGPIGIFANRGAASTPDTYGNHTRSASMIDSRHSTIMRTNRLNFANRQSNLVNPSSEISSPAKQKSVQGQLGNNIANVLSSVPSYTSDSAATTGRWTNNKLFGGKYAGSGRRGNEIDSGDYSEGLAQHKSTLFDGQSVFGTPASTLTQQRNRFRYNVGNLGQIKNPSAFGRITGITDTTSLANRTSSLK